MAAIESPSWLGPEKLEHMHEEAMAVELKSIERIDPIHQAQLKVCVRSAASTIGLLANFKHLCPRVRSLPALSPMISRFTHSSEFLPKDNP